MLLLVVFEIALVTLLTSIAKRATFVPPIAIPLALPLTESVSSGFSFVHFLEFEAENWLKVVPKDTVELMGGMGGMGGFL